MVSPTPSAQAWPAATQLGCPSVRREDQLLVKYHLQPLHLGLWVEGLLLQSYSGKWCWRGPESVRLYKVEYPNYVSPSCPRVVGYSPSQNWRIWTWINTFLKHIMTERMTHESKLKDEQWMRDEDDNEFSPDSVRL